MLKAVDGKISVAELVVQFADADAADLLGHTDFAVNCLEHCLQFWRQLCIGRERYGSALRGADVKQSSIGGHRGQR